jgi:hypothetical protein
MANSDGPWHDKACANYAEWVRGMARELDTPRADSRASRIVLDVTMGISEEEVPYLRQIFYDAFGEFLTARSSRDEDLDSEDPDADSGVAAYVARRYPELMGRARNRKIGEVLLRKAIARKLRLAASAVRVEK